MKKNLLTVGLLLLAFSAHAQVLTHVDKSGIFYVGKDALVYNGGGLQTKDNGLIENHGSIMVDGTANDEINTLDATGAKKQYVSTSDVNFINKINETGNFAQWNDPTPGVIPSYTYGQLLINGIPQAKITGMVIEEFKTPAHGDYQQISMPFFNKKASTLNSELGKTFSTVRRSENEILVWDNGKVVFHHLDDLSKILGQDGTLWPYSYYSLGMKNLDISNGTKLLKGEPVSNLSNNSILLSNAGFGINFGAGGNGLNPYGGKYNSYLGDLWAVKNNHIWDGVDYGKNIYQIGNPYMTNLDLSNIRSMVTNILGIRFEPSGVVFNTNTGGGPAAVKYVTFNSSGIAVGDYQYMMVRPMGTFVIKLADNSKATNLDLSKLRSLDYNFSTSGTTQAGAKIASKTSISKVTSGTLKQLAVIGLNSEGAEIARTYYVVAPDLVSGNSVNTITQVANGPAILGTYEEDVNVGGYDEDFKNSYWLYINEANEADFLGKNVKLVKYSNTIAKFKFEILENGKGVQNGVHKLSSGEGFYFKGIDGTVKPVLNNEIITANGNDTQEYDLYYGAPGNDSTLGLGNSKAPSRTFVVYNPNISSYIVRFDPNWKNSDINIFDLSGKLVSTSKGVSAASDFVLKLEGSPKGVYLVVAKSNSGEVIQSKIIKQ